jgi:hypothetical protein
MENLINSPSNREPLIVADSQKGTVQVSGLSIPDNPTLFYKALIDWVEEYFISGGNSLEIDFLMLYFGNGSSKSFFNLFKLLEKQHANGKQVSVNWYYFPDDIDIKEDGEEFAEFFKFPFNITEKQLPSTFSHKMTDAAPLVYYDDSVDIIIEGSCVHSEPWVYFYPLVLWLEMLRYNEPEAISFNVDFFIHSIDENNLNYLTHIIHLLKLIGDKCQCISITWKYKNDIIKQLGEELLIDSKLNHMFKCI